MSYLAIFQQKKCKFFNARKKVDKQGPTKMPKKMLTISVKKIQKQYLSPKKMKKMPQ